MNHYQQIDTALSESMTSFLVQRPLAEMFEHCHRRTLKELALNGQKVPIMYKLTTNHLCKRDAIIYATNLILNVGLLVPDLTN